MISGDDISGRTPVEYTLRYIATDEQHLHDNLQSIVPYVFILLFCFYICFVFCFRFLIILNQGIWHPQIHSNDQFPGESIGVTSQQCMSSILLPPPSLPSPLSRCLLSTISLSLSPHLPLSLFMLIVFIRMMYFQFDLKAHPNCSQGTHMYLNRTFLSFFQNLCLPQLSSDVPPPSPLSPSLPLPLSLSPSLTLSLPLPPSLSLSPYRKTI